MSDPGFGIERGATCWRGGCQGIIESREKNCSCHITPPCQNCVDGNEFCQECGWESWNEKPEINGFVSKNVGGVQRYELAPLDPRKIDYHIKRHTHSSQICEGVYPPGTTAQQILDKVKGTFGGRFEKFDGGRFRYVAYTD